MLKIYFIFINIFLFVSCNQRNFKDAGEEIAYIYNIEYEDDKYPININPILTSFESLPKPSSVMEYFAGTPKELTYLEGYWPKSDYYTFLTNLQILDEYDEWQFHDSILVEEIARQQEIVAHSNSEGYEENYIDAATLLNYRFIQQVLNHIKDIKCFADYITNDNQVGLLDFKLHTHSYQPAYSILMFKKQPDQWIPYIKFGFAPNNVYHFDIEGEDYYLFTHRSDAFIYYGCYLDCALFLNSGGNWEEIEIKNKHLLDNWLTKSEEKEGEISSVEVWNGIITFNQKEIRWNICYEEGGIFYPHPGTKNLILNISNHNAFYELR